MGHNNKTLFIRDDVNKYSSTRTNQRRTHGHLFDILGRRQGFPAKKLRSRTATTATTRQVQSFRCTLPLPPSLPTTELTGVAAAVAEKRTAYSTTAARISPWGCPSSIAKTWRWGCMASEGRESSHTTLRSRCLARTPTVCLMLTGYDICEKFRVFWL